MTTCSICMQAPINVMFVVCKHANCCQTCVDTLLIKQSNPRCPMCRVELIPDSNGKVYELFYLDGVKTEVSSSSEIDAELRVKIAEREAQLKALNQKLLAGRQELQKQSSRSSSSSISRPGVGTVVESPNRPDRPLRNIRVTPNIQHLITTSLEEWSTESHNYEFRDLREVYNNNRRMLLKYKNDYLRLQTPTLRSPYGLLRKYDNHLDHQIDRLDIAIAFDANQTLLAKMLAVENMVAEYLYSTWSTASNSSSLFLWRQSSRNKLTLQEFKDNLFATKIRGRPPYQPYMILTFNTVKNSHNIIESTTTKILKDDLPIRELSRDDIVINSQIKCIITPHVWFSTISCGVTWTIRELVIV